MKKMNIISVAAFVMLGAGPVFAPVISVCTDPNPDVARIATHYYNELRFSQDGVKLSEVPAALVNEALVTKYFPSYAGATIDEAVEGLQKGLARAVDTEPLYDLEGAKPNANFQSRGDMGIVDANLYGTGTDYKSLEGSTSIMERIIALGTAVEANGEGSQAPLTPDTTYPGLQTSLAVRLDDLNSLIGAKKVYTEEMANANGGDAANIGLPIKEGGGTTTLDGVDAAAPLDNYPLSKWKDPEGALLFVKNQSMCTQLKSMLTAIDAKVKAGFTIVPTPGGVSSIQELLQIIP